MVDLRYLNSRVAGFHRGLVNLGLEFGIVLTRCMRNANRDPPLLLAIPFKCSARDQDNNKFVVYVICQKLMNRGQSTSCGWVGGDFGRVWQPATRLLLRSRCVHISKMIQLLGHWVRISHSGPYFSTYCGAELLWVCPEALGCWSTGLVRCEGICQGTGMLGGWAAGMEPFGSFRDWTIWT